MEVRRSALGCAMFDLDGTLLDSMYVWRRVDYLFLGKRDIELPDDYVKAISPMTARECAEYTIRRFQLVNDTPEGLIAEWNALALREYAENVQLKPGALEYLTQLKRAGVRICTVSTLDLKLARPALERCGALELLDAMYSADRHGPGKARPELYARAAAEMNTPVDRCVMYDDLAYALRAARSAGMYTVGVFDALAEDAPHDACDRYIKDFSGEFEAMTALFGANM